MTIYREVIQGISIELAPENPRHSAGNQEGDTMPSGELARIAENLINRGPEWPGVRVVHWDTRNDTVRKVIEAKYSPRLAWSEAARLEYLAQHYPIGKMCYVAGPSATWDANGSHGEWGAIVAHVPLAEAGARIGYVVRLAASERVLEAATDCS